MSKTELTKVFIDGSEGTTGLKIAQRLKERSDVELINIDPALRKDENERAKCINSSDITFLCLPDAAAVQAVSLVENKNVRIIDASTAHRTSPDWVYGLPELSLEQFEKIKSANRVAVPGCHAGGFITLAYPLIKSGLLSPEEKLSVFSLTGYSGGGKKMIAEYDSEGRSTLLNSPRQYGVTQSHKHLKEMTKISGLTHSPVFSPIVCDFYSGMEVTLPLFSSQVGGRQAEQIRNFYAEYYSGSKLIKVLPFSDKRAGGFLPANLLSGRDDLRIFVSGAEDRIIVSALFDNLGKGASGAAIECMNIMLGLDETSGLIISDKDF